MRQRIVCNLTSVWLALLLAGCASTPKTFVGSDGVTYTETIHNLRVWKADNFSLANAPSIAVAPTKSEVPPQEEKDEAEQFIRVEKTLPAQLIAALSTKQIAANVDHAGLVNDPAFILEPSIIDYYTGNAALRFTVGFGAGFPSITVRGLLRETATGNIVFRFQTQREFEPRIFEYGDEQILQGNIKDLAIDLADYLHRLKTGTVKD